MINFQVRHLMGVVECHQLIAVPITTGKKNSGCLSVVTPFQLQPEKNDTVVWPSFVAPFQLPLLCRSNYDPKKKDTVVCLLLRHFKYNRNKQQKSGGCATVITTGKKSSSRLSDGCMIVITTGKKKF